MGSAVYPEMRVGRDGDVCALCSKLGSALQHNQCSDSGRPRRENRGIPRLGLRFGERLRADYSPKEESPGQGVAQFEGAPLSAPSPWDTSVFVPRKGKYYLICNYDKCDDVSNYRIDRLADQVRAEAERTIKAYRELEG